MLWVLFSISYLGFQQSWLAHPCTTVTTKQRFANAVYVCCVLLIFPLLVFCVYCLSVLLSSWMRVCVVIATYFELCACFLAFVCCMIQYFCISFVCFMAYLGVFSSVFNMCSFLVSWHGYFFVM